MKSFVLVTFLFFLTFSFGQAKDSIVLKVYLEDAYTNKNIKDGKVTLEGFEIPEIVGQYDKKGRFYYFTKIPKGYNTIIAYHKKYNEKGFQDTESFPKEIRLKLCNPLNVSYSFEKSGKSHFQNIYIEDPYKFAITSVGNGDYNIFRKYLLNELERLKIDLELVNPYLEMEFNLQIPKNFRNRLPFLEGNKNSYQIKNGLKQNEAYPDIPTFPLFNIDDYILPLLNDMSTYDKVIDNGGKSIIRIDQETKVVFYLRKKNGKKFKRYNDPLLKRINEVANINIYSVLYNKCQLVFKNGRQFKNVNSRELDKFNIIKNIDSSKIFFYSRIRELKYENRIMNNFFSVKHKLKIGRPDLKLEFHNTNMLESLEKEYTSSPKLVTILKNRKIMKFDSAIGLGIMDQLERIGDSLQLGNE
jgi:hypothetical protein